MFGPGTEFVLFHPQVSVYLQNWSHVLSYVSKAESTPEIAEVRTRPLHNRHDCTDPTSLFGFKAFS